MMTIQQNIVTVTQQIEQCCAASQRNAAEVALLAVSKFHPVTAIAAAIEAGLCQFGENYAQEGVAKILHFQHSATVPRLIWHFIGPIQSNKTKLIAQHFDWVQSVERLKIAQRLSAQRPTHLAPLQVLIQVNISQAATKSGIQIEEILPLAEAINDLPQLTLRGLMAIPSHQINANEHLALLSKMHDAFLTLSARYGSVDTLSMGMSNDMPTAIQAGSTMVRIGTAIFGTRNS